ncbi:unnamed protein product [Sphenostylis stenocarpa]|uniref:Uncharacterized protein n=1 Tax=Sphenostylis stenocarpa TaxID=92480 RepID=A0AA86SC04_9FABA|nr:unnamed protein product [Sphenostylis stenocarpa]
MLCGGMLVTNVLCVQGFYPIVPFSFSLILHSWVLLHSGLLDVVGSTPQWVTRRRVRGFCYGVKENKTNGRQRL